MGIRRGQGRNPEILDDPKRGGGERVEKGRKGRGNTDKNAGVMDDLSRTGKGGGERDNREEGILIETQGLEKNTSVPLMLFSAVK